MSNKSTARVIQIQGNKYILKGLENKNTINASLSGKVKRNNSIVVGDIVKVEKNYDRYIIQNILERKNYIIRPPVANIDNLVIVLALATPQPDYYLLDKQIILCRQKEIKPIICINKVDLLEENKKLQSTIDYIKSVYENIGIDVILVSAKNNNGIEILETKLIGEISAFSGNSGVGKSSIIKNMALSFSNEEIEINDIGRKTQKGRHTTKYVKLYETNKRAYILDTPGFSSYELFNISHKSLRNYYDEFSSYRCKYEDCTHVNEDSSVCAIKYNVEKCNIDKGRYERYVYLYNVLKEQESRKYK